MIQPEKPEFWAKSTSNKMHLALLNSALSCLKFLEQMHGDFHANKKMRQDRYLEISYAQLHTLLWPRPIIKLQPLIRHGKKRNWCTFGFSKKCYPLSLSPSERVRSINPCLSCHSLGKYESFYYVSIGSQQQKWEKRQWEIDRDKKAKVLKEAHFFCLDVSLPLSLEVSPPLLSRTRHANSSIELLSWKAALIKRFEGEPKTSLAFNAETTCSVQ